MRYIYILLLLLLNSLAFTQNNCEYNAIPCDFPCEQYAIDEDGCSLCECSDGWTPINQDGCYDSSGETYFPGDLFFVSSCEYVECLEVADGWGGVLDNGVWSDWISLDDCFNNEDGVCQTNLQIISGSYDFFDDNLDLLSQELVLVPVYSTGDVLVSSYQFNIIYNHLNATISLDDIGTVNSSIFYNIYNLDSANSDTNSGGVFSANIVQIDDTFSIIAIAYATSQIESIGDKLLYIPMNINTEECVELVFSDGFINNEYIYPNQTNELLISNQDLSSCVLDGVICLNCIDDNQNVICDSNEYLGCTDEMACNYFEEATIDDESCLYEGDSCFIVVDSDCCCCGVCDCVCEQEIISPLVCEGELTGDYESPWNLVLEGEIQNCECDAQDLIGCMDITACNYNENVILDNGSCIYPNNCEDCGAESGLQSIYLSTGWSLFSTYLCPESPSMDSLMIDLVDSDNLIIVKDQNGMVYWPQFNINQIGDLVNGKGYLLKIIDAAVLDINGVPLGYDYPLSINAGWSYLGYLHQESYPIEDLLAPIVSEVLIVKNSLGNVYWPQFALNNIQTMNPGEGYQINLFNESNFSYPWLDMDGRYADFSSEFNFSNSKFSKPLNTGNNMTIGIPNEAWIEQPGFGDEIIAYDSEGLIVGIAKYREEGTVITVWGDDQFTDQKDGMLVGEKIIFKLWDFNKNQESLLDINHWDSGSDIYEIDGVCIASNVSLSLDFFEKKLLKVFDVLGRETDKKGFNIEYYNDGSVIRSYYVNF
mgnify:CR=1 FL=1